jgi:hypothetical protein
MGFNLVDLAITVRANDADRLIKCLPLLGGRFAEACRSLTCHWPDRACETCSTQHSCSWFLVFGQKLTLDPAALKRHQKPPLPFVFSFPESDACSEERDDFVVGLVVVGQAIQQLGMLLNGFDELLSSGLSPVSAEIVQVACRDYQGAVQATYIDTGNLRSLTLIPENLVIVSTEGLLESQTWTGSNLQIQLRSPLRIFEDGNPVARFEFCRFARSVMRRVSSLAYYYGESEFDCDYKELSRQIVEVICTDDHFHYKSAENRRISGITGYGSFLGDFSRLEPFLVIGTYVHAGKSASFGMGEYKVVPLCDN